MRIELALFATLERYLPASSEAGSRPGSRVLDVPDGTTIGEVIATLQLPDEPRVIFVNGRHASEDDALTEGDRLAIFPPVAGG